MSYGGREEVRGNGVGELGRINVTSHCGHNGPFGERALHSDQLTVSASTTFSA